MTTKLRPVTGIDQTGPGLLGRLRLSGRLDRPSRLGRPVPRDHRARGDHEGRVHLGGHEGPEEREGEERRPGQLSGPAVMALAYLAGSLPFSNLAAGRLRGVDLRRVGSGTVSGTGLYQVAGFRSLALVGCLDVAKGALGVALAPASRPVLRAGAAGAVLSGHNWSPLLRGAGGRGLAPALGATLVLAPEATVLLGIGLGGGRLVRHTAAGCFWSTMSLLPLLAATRGPAGLLAGGAIAAPLLAKRVLGNTPPARRSLAVYLSRLVLDRDQPALRPALAGGGTDHHGHRHRH